MASPPRPDPKEGVFETLLVADGRPVELEGHLARLNASVYELYGYDRAAEAEGLMVKGAAGTRLGRLRLTVRPGPDDGLAYSIGVREVDPDLVLQPARRPIALRTVEVPWGIGPHKWADRAVFDQMEDAVGHHRDASQHEVLPLLTDDGGTVLEGSRANVFAVRDGVLVTPPIDGRILPGVVRSAVLALAPAIGLTAEESVVSVADLLAADEVFLTGSVRGVVAVCEIDGTELQPKGDVTRRTAEALRSRWLG